MLVAEYERHGRSGNTGKASDILQYSRFLDHTSLRRGWHLVIHSRGDHSRLT